MLNPEEKQQFRPRAHEQTEIGTSGNPTNRDGGRGLSPGMSEMSITLLQTSERASERRGARPQTVSRLL